MTGRTGDAARTVAKLMHPHFLKEEEYALPPLGLLRDLAKGTIAAEMRDVLGLTDKLRTDVVEFARRLTHHAMIEEQVMYPAALLAGEYVRLRLGSSEG